MSGSRVSTSREHGVDLDAGDVRAEAEVRAAAAEGDVLVRRAADVEACRGRSNARSSRLAEP